MISVIGPESRENLMNLASRLWTRCEVIFPDVRRCLRLALVSCTGIPSHAVYRPLRRSRPLPISRPHGPAATRGPPVTPSGRAADHVLSAVESQPVAGKKHTDYNRDRGIENAYLVMGCAADIFDVQAATAGASRIDSLHRETRTIRVPRNALHSLAGKKHTYEILLSPFQISDY